MITLVFLFFKLLTLSAAITVVCANNPVFSILGLILAFGNTTIILLLLNVEFLALSLLLVYVGAIAVLFLLLIMMLNIKLTELALPNINYIPITFLVAGFVVVLLSYSGISQNYVDFAFGFNKTTNFWIEKLDQISDISVIGQVLFLFYSPSIYLYGAHLTLPLLCLGLLSQKTSKFTKRQLSKANFTQKSLTLFNEIPKSFIVK